MSFVALTCPKCGGPLPKEALKRAVLCQHCGASVMHDRWTVRRRDFALAREGERRAARRGPAGTLEIAGRAYAVLEKIATGDSTDVWLCERADGPRERVVVRTLRHADDAPGLERSCAALGALAQRPGLARRVPLLRHRGSVANGSGAGAAAVLGYESGFFQSLWDVRQAQGAALDPGHAVWIWRRILDVLSRVHAAGFVHRALVPPHLLVHARDHGVLLVGWGQAVQGERKLEAAVEPFTPLYPEEVLAGRPFTAHDDVLMSARVVGWLLSNDATWTPPRSTPAPLRDLIEAVGAATGTMSTQAPAVIDEELKRRAALAFGKPVYRHLGMPGWK